MPKPFPPSKQLFTHLMKNRMLFLLLFSSFCLSLFSQEKAAIAALEKQADSLYFDLVNPRDEASYLLEKELREEVLSMYADTTTSSYRHSLAKKYGSQALLLMETHDYANAIKASENSIALLKQVDQADLVFKGYLYRRLYHQHAYSGDWKTAYPLTRETLEIFKDTLVDNHKLVADVEFDIGYAASQFGDIPTVIKQFELAKDKYISFQGKNDYDVGQKYLHLATVYGSIGYYKKELDCFLQAVEILEAIDYRDKSYLAIAYGNTATWYLQHGDYKKAEQYVLKREKLIEKYKKPGAPWHNETFLGRTEFNSKRSKANLFLKRNDTVKAAALNNEIINKLVAYDLNDEGNNPNNIRKKTLKNWIKYRTIIALRFKADILQKRNSEEAKALHEQALSIKKQNGLRESGLADRLFLIGYHAKQRNYASATEIIDQGVTVAIANKNDYAFMRLYGKKAAIAFEQDSLAKMHSTYKKLFRMLQKDSIPIIALKKLTYENCKPYGNNAIIDIVTQAAGYYSQLFEKEKDSQNLRIAHNLSILSSDMFTINNQDLIYNDQSYSSIEEINEQLLRTSLLLDNDIDRSTVLQKIEQSKSRYSWKAFLSSNERKNLNIPDSILELEQNLQADLHYYRKALFIGEDPSEEKTKLWKTKLLDAEQRLDTLEQWLQKKYPKYHDLVQKPFQTKQLQAGLKNNQSLINYVSGSENVYAFIITADHIELVKIGSKIALNKQILQLLKSLEDRTSNGYRVFAKNLYQTLIPKAIQENNTKEELIFVRDQRLHYVPMEILIGADDTFLLRNHPVSYAASLLLWSEQLKVKRTKRNKTGVFVPVYSKQNQDSPERGDFTELIGAATEADAIAEIFDADIFSGKAFNKSLFIDNAAQYDILHLAMHADLNNVDAEFSNLSFSNDETGKLFVSELYGIPMNAALAVLSACNTGTGALKNGEGIMNISRAFTYAGVPSTVTSQWKVPDDKTAQIMISFYSYLKEGLPKNRAMQLAKLDYLEGTDDALLKHPYYWAGFVVSGNITPLGSDPFNWWWLLVIPLGILLWWYQKKRKSV